MRTYPWTPEQDAQLRELWKGSDTLLDIGLALGRTALAVKIRASKLRLGSHDVNNYHWTKQEIALFDEMRQTGATPAEISEAMGRSELAVRMRIWRVNTPRKRFDSQKHYKPRARFGRETRNCLCCKRDFSSEWIGNRLCTQCKDRGHAPIEVGF